MSLVGAIAGSKLANTCASARCPASRAGSRRPCRSPSGFTSPLALFAGNVPAGNTKRPSAIRARREVLDERDEVRRRRPGRPVRSGRRADRRRARCRRPTRTRRCSSAASSTRTTRRRSRTRRDRSTSRGSAATCRSRCRAARDRGCTREVAAHRLGERLAGDLHLARGEHVLAGDEAGAAAVAVIVAVCGGGSLASGNAIPASGISCGAVDDSPPHARKSAIGARAPPHRSVARKIEAKKQDTKQSSRPTVRPLAEERQDRLVRCRRAAGSISFSGPCAGLLGTS